MPLITAMMSLNKISKKMYKRLQIYKITRKDYPPYVHGWYKCIKKTEQKKMETLIKKQ